MSIHRRRRIDRETAERMLSGQPVDGRGADPLANLLASLAHAPRPAEYAGEESVVYAFREARLGPASTPRGRTMRRTALARLLTVKMAALIGILTAGGYALAAGAGIAPNPLDEKPGAAPTTMHTTGRPAPRPASSHPGSPANPSPSMVGLCRAYQNLAEKDRGKALESPAFTALVTTAGGRDKVDEYCAGVLASAAPNEPAHPTGPPSAHPTEPPEHPTGPASAHPTGPEKTKKN